MPAPFIYVTVAHGYPDVISTNVRDAFRYARSACRLHESDQVIYRAQTVDPGAEIIAIYTWNAAKRRAIRCV